MHNHFHGLRLRLADCRTTLRTYKYEHDIVKAQQEQAAIDSGKVGGKNAEERERNLTLVLASNERYQEALAELRRAEHEVERVEALLEAAKDERRAGEWQIRAKLADGLFRAGVPSDEQAGDEAFDDTADFELDYYAEEAARDNADPELAAVGSNGHNALDDEDFPF